MIIFRPIILFHKVYFIKTLHVWTMRKIIIWILTIKWEGNLRWAKNTELHLFSYFFSIHTICINHVIRVCYSTFNCSTKNFLINCSNTMCYACFQFRNILYASTIDMIFVEFPLPVVTGIKAWENKRPCSQKTSKFPDHF